MISSIMSCFVTDILIKLYELIESYTKSWKNEKWENTIEDAVSLYQLGLRLIHENLREKEEKINTVLAFS